MSHELVRARAPLRLGFGGGGTDVSPYCDEYGGVVLNAAIDLFAHVSVQKRDDDQVLLVAADRDQSWQAPANAPLPTDEPLRLLKGVYNRFMADYAGLAALNEARILGIFARLIARDGKPRYRAFMPRMWAHLNANLKAPGLKAVASWMDRHVPLEMRA